MKSPNPFNVSLPLMAGGGSPGWPRSLHPAEYDAAMRNGRRGAAAGITLGGSIGLHAFTHAYGAMLVPLYLLITADLRLPGLGRATLLVTVYGLVYFLLSYPAGMLADRVNRKNLLGLALLLNAAAITLMGITRQYHWLVVLAVVAGIAGSVFHPTANSLASAHFPKSPGLAIGLLGIGAGIGFFVGPQFAGWRADRAGWQAPCVDLGIAGAIFAGLFLLLASESGPPAIQSIRPPMPRALRRRVLLLASVLMFRDFAGVAALSLVGIYLEKAFREDARQAGLICGLMMLIGVVVNPLAVWLTPGRRRLPMLTVVLIIGGLIIATAPLWSEKWVLLPLCGFAAMQLGSYAMSDAAMMERVPPPVRGRVVGLFLSIAGVFSSFGPWVMGKWIDHLGPRASMPHAYFGPFALIAAMMLLAAFSPPILATLGEPDEPPIDPIAETLPGTIGVTG
jgi:MFS family permease